MAAVDTSCSISDKMLVEISDELRHLARDHEIIVVECDTEIQAVYDYKRPITEVRGRGGTDLRPPLESSFLRKHRVDLAVFFTDGYGPAPDRKPQVPVLWALAPGGESPAAWGKVVKMEE
jgi:predicted metal-dependent peptidase